MPLTVTWLVVVLGQAGDAAVGVAPDVVRDQLDGGVGATAAAADPGAPVAVFNRRGPAFQGGEGAAEVDCS